MHDPTLEAALLDAANAAYVTQQLVDQVARSAFCEDFLRRWLISSENPLALNPTSASGSYFFLFWKNLSVTNVSVVELASLLRIHVRDRASDAHLQIDFISTEDYKVFLINLWESLFPTDERLVNERIKEAVDQILRFHETFFKRTVIFDTYYTSALIHIPMSLKINIGAVTIESGYVHSAGLAIYVRNIEKAEQLKFISRLGNFLELHKPKRFFISPYATEFFSPFESKSSASIRNGLDGVRLHLRKHYFENESLLNFLTRLKEYFPKQLSIPLGVRDYADERALSRSDGADEGCTIWFVADVGVNFNAKDRVANKSKNSYIMAYAQTHLNNDQLIIFKERKPAWVASTTLPHTLSAAMVNIAKHHWQLARNEKTTKKERVVILDPFCGTGTTLLDAFARFENATIIGMDQAPIMPILVRNNLEFFSTEVSKISRMLAALRATATHLSTEMNEPHADGVIARLARHELIKTNELPKDRIPGDDFEFCLSLLIDEINFTDHGNGEISDAAVVGLANRGFSEGLITKLDSAEFPFRMKIMLYMLWRALLMNTFSIRPEARTGKVILGIFLEELLNSIKEYQDLEKLLKRPVARDGQPFSERIGSYSREGAIHPDFFGGVRATPVCYEAERLTTRSINGLDPGLVLCRTIDSISLLEKFEQVADLIITDPPYGFNAPANIADDTRALYARMIPALIDALKPSGQLMLALPAFAKNGKQIPFYQTRESVMKQVGSHVEARGRKIVKYVETLPADREVFRLPWYWGTASTIERRIIHIVVD